MNWNSPRLGYRQMDSYFHCLFSLTGVWLTAILSGCLADNKRYTELPFPNRTVLYGRVVSCQNPEHSDMVYEAETWSCRDMRIDGHRLRYWYRVPDHYCTDAAADFDEGDNSNENDVAGLCREMLKANNVRGHLRTAFIHDPSCRHSGRERIRFGRNSSSSGFSWHLHEDGPGYMKTLRCMLLEP